MDVNEVGTEATSITVIEGEYTADISDKPIVVNLNSPFIYIISEYSTGAILFMGIENKIN